MSSKIISTYFLWAKTNWNYQKCSWSLQICLSGFKLFQNLSNYTFAVKVFIQSQTSNPTEPLPSCRNQICWNSSLTYALTMNLDGCESFSKKTFFFKNSIELKVIGFQVFFRRFLNFSVDLQRLFTKDKFHNKYTLICISNQIDLGGEEAIKLTAIFGVSS